MTFHHDAVSTPTEVRLLRDTATGLNGAIVLHSTTLGPAAGGCRLWSYPSNEAMLADGCRLAEGMSYKNALADLPLGGGKAVLRTPDGPFDRAALFRAFGRAVQELRGSYLTAEDVGTSVEDMEVVRGETRHVAGLPLRVGRPGGDPSPWTARGVFLAMQVAVERRLSRPLSDCTVAIQGVGHVGAALAHMLFEAGARLIVADVNGQSAARIAVATGALVTGVDSIFATKADVFAPCALGGVLSHETIARLNAKVVCGAANNQLATVEDGDRLADRGVLYAPDYLVNAGGIINVAGEHLGWTESEVAARVDATPDRLRRVLDHAEAAGLAAHTAADQLARAAIARRGMAQRAA